MCWNPYCRKNPAKTTLEDGGDGGEEDKSKDTDTKQQKVEMTEERSTVVNTPDPRRGNGEENSQSDYTIATINSFKGEKDEGVDINEHQGDGDGSITMIGKTPQQDTRGAPPVDLWSGICRLQDFVCFSTVPSGETAEWVHRRTLKEQTGTDAAGDSGTGKWKTNLPRLHYYRV